MSAVKIGEDKSVLSTGKKNFFSGFKPRKDLHYLHWSGFVGFGTRSTGQKTVIFSYRRAKSEAK
jgi:hypothetical protein